MRYIDRQGREENTQENLCALGVLGGKNRVFHPISTQSLNPSNWAISTRFAAYGRPWSSRSIGGSLVKVLVDHRSTVAFLQR